MIAGRGGKKKREEERVRGVLSAASSSPETLESPRVSCLRLGREEQVATRLGTQGDRGSLRYLSLLVETDRNEGEDFTWKRVSCQPVTDNVPTAVQGGVKKTALERRRGAVRARRLLMKQMKKARKSAPREHPGDCVHTNTSRRHTELCMSSPVGGAEKEEEKPFFCCLLQQQVLEEQKKKKRREWKVSGSLRPYVHVRDGHRKEHLAITLPMSWTQLLICIQRDSESSITPSNCMDYQEYKNLQMYISTLT